MFYTKQALSTVALPARETVESQREEGEERAEEKGKGATGRQDQGLKPLVFHSWCMSARSSGARGPASRSAIQLNKSVAFIQHAYEVR